MSGFASEQELAQHVVAWLQAQHWDVYQEVSTGYSCARADIVAVQNGLSWIIETKTSLSLDLLAQAVRWVGRANFISVAVPRGYRCSPGREFAVGLLRREGIGMLEIESDGGILFHSPRKFRRTARSIGDILCDAQKTMAEAGSSRGGYATPFAVTCREARRFIVEHPGCTMCELVDGIEHHYGLDATARACLNNWLGTKKIPNVERRHEDGVWRLFPTGGGK